MKTKTLAFITAVIFAILFFTGCGSSPASLSAVSSVASVSLPPEPPPLTELEQKIADAERLCAETPSAENYNMLAGFYGQAGLIRKQRDILEMCFNRFADTAAFDALQSIVVNAAEDEMAVQLAAKQLMDNLLVTDYNKEAAAQLIDTNWLSIMMPALGEGRRSYYMEDANAQNTLYFEVGYDAEHGGLAYTRVWLTSSTSGKLTYLLKQGNAIQFVYTSATENIYNGEFSAWRYIGSLGMVYHDEGTFENGILVGEFTSTVYEAADAVDLYALVSSQEGLSETVYKGDFGTNGVTTMRQPSGAGNFVAYAFTDDNKNYLTYGMVGDESPGAYAFGSSFFGMPLYPAFVRYTPVPLKEEPAQEVTVDLSQVQLRINGTNVEWFDGESWHVVTTTGELYAQDPSYVPPPPDTGDTTPVEDDENLWYMRGSASSGGGGGSGSPPPVNTRPPASSSAPPPVEEPPPEPQPEPPPPQPEPPPPQPEPPPASSELPPPTDGDGDDIGWSDNLL